MGPRAAAITTARQICEFMGRFSGDKAAIYTIRSYFALELHHFAGQQKSSYRNLKNTPEFSLLA
jgi:hypothetical protein